MQMFDTMFYARDFSSFLLEFCFFDYVMMEELIAYEI